MSIKYYLMLLNFRSYLFSVNTNEMLWKKSFKVYPCLKKSYFRWFGNPACGDSTGSNQIENNQGRVSARLVWGKRGEWAVWFSVCGAPSDDWANGGYIDVLFTCGECGFGSLGSWYYSKEWAWNLGAKCVMKWNARRVTLRNLILGIDSCGIANLTAYLWPSG